MQTSPPLIPGILKSTWYFLRMTALTAIVLATLFTAFTPAGLLPSALAPDSPFINDDPQRSAFLTPTPRARPHLGIVAGHWGNDSGAVCSDGLTEMEINLNVASLVKEYLTNAGFEIDLLQEFDPKLAGYQALALVSIHTDSCLYINDLATGFKVAPALGNAQPERSSRLAACLRNRYARSTGLAFHANTITPDMTSYHAFDEIHNETPAAIIEIGFMNLDRQILTREPEKIAAGIAEGILCFIYNEDINNPQP
ncbi:MAG: hypothetical protein OHK0052_06400 [Anaerolineales bacterium]